MHIWNLYLLSVCYYTIVSTGDRFRCAGEYRIQGSKPVSRETSTPGRIWATFVAACLDEPVLWEPDNGIDREYCLASGIGRASSLPIYYRNRTTVPKHHHFCIETDVTSQICTRNNMAWSGTTGRFVDACDMFRDM